MSTFKSFLFALLVVLSPACDSDHGKPVDKESSVVDEYHCGFTQEMQKLVHYHNEARISDELCGGAGAHTVRPKLVWNCQLHEVALRQSRDMLESGTLSHRSSNGDGLPERLHEVAYKWRTAAENVSRGYTNARSVVNGWLRSDQHCLNLIDVRYNEVGAARAGDYWAVVFAKPG